MARFRDGHTFEVLAFKVAGAGFRILTAGCLGDLTSGGPTLKIVSCLHLFALTMPDFGFDSLEPN